MSSEQNNALKQAADESLIESLIQESFHALESTSQDERRITKLLVRLDQESLDQRKVTTKSLSTKLLKRAVSFAIAACLLIAAGYVMISASADNQAYAAVTRVLEAPRLFELMRLP